MKINAQSKKKLGLDSKVNTGVAAEAVAGDDIGCNTELNAIFGSHIAPLSGVVAVAIATVCLLGPWAIGGCKGKQKPRKKKKSSVVQTHKAKVMKLVDRVDLTGSVEPVRVAQMSAPIDGPVIGCSTREGDKVAAGKVLVKLGRASGDYATWKSARAKLSKARVELERIQKLVDAGALPGEKLDEARVVVSEAKAEMARAAEKLDDYRIVAPWPGIVSKIHVEVGHFVSARQSLVELFDPKSLVLQFSVPEHKAVDVRPESVLEFSLDAYPGRKLTAKVSRLYPELNRNTRTRTVEAKIDDAVDLIPGMFARISLIFSTVEAGVAVDREAVLQRNKKTFVAIIKAKRSADKRATVELRRVRTGIEDGHWVQIVSGVQPGEQVAVAGHRRLRNGMKVKISQKKQKDQTGPQTPQRRQTSTGPQTPRSRKTPSSQRTVQRRGHPENVVRPGRKTK